MVPAMKQLSSPSQTLLSNNFSEMVSQVGTLGTNLVPFLTNVNGRDAVLSISIEVLKNRLEGDGPAIEMY